MPIWNSIFGWGGLQSFLLTVLFTLSASARLQYLNSLHFQDWGFFVGYIIPTLALALGVLVFVSGSKRYKKLKPEGSVINQVHSIPRTHQQTENLTYTSMIFQ